MIWKFVCRFRAWTAERRIKKDPRLEPVLLLRTHLAELERMKADGTLRCYVPEGRTADEHRIFGYQPSTEEVRGDRQKCIERLNREPKSISFFVASSEDIQRDPRLPSPPDMEFLRLREWGFMEWWIRFHHDQSPGGAMDLKIEKVEIVKSLWYLDIHQRVSLYQLTAEDREAIWRIRDLMREAEIIPATAESQAA